MFARGGYYRGSTVLVSGTAGTGKTSLGAHFVEAACGRGEPAIYFAFEESPSQIIRNVASIGVDLGRWVKKGLLQISASRPSAFGMEMHLVRMHQLVARHKPGVVVIDPISGLIPNGSKHDIMGLVLRLVDFLKDRGITALFTSIAETDNLETTQISISSLVDTWILLRNIEVEGERNRVLYVLKSRGMAHSNQVREFLLTGGGVQLRDVYIGPGGFLTGSARVQREAEERRREELMRRDARQKETAARVSLRALEAQIAALEADKKARESDLAAFLGENEAIRRIAVSEREAMERSRSNPLPDASKTVRPNGRGGRV